MTSAHDNIPALTDALTRSDPLQLTATTQADEWVLNMGPQHPATHGILRLEMQTKGEIVQRLVPHIGYLHRCFEKHAEKCTYPQIIPYVDRMDYLAAMNNEHAYVMGVEELLGITGQLPDRVEYIRILVAELNRLASHFMGLGTYAMDLGMTSGWLWMMRYREHIVRLFEWLSGARLLYNYLWIGGLYYDLPIDFEKKCGELLPLLRQGLVKFKEALLDNPIFIGRTAQVGVLSLEQAIAYGASGPVLRASGLRYDIRRIDGYSRYDALSFPIPIGTNEVGVVGDCYNRTFVRYEECKASIMIVEQCLDALQTHAKRDRQFDPQALVPKKVRPKAQQLYARAENPRGELGFCFVTTPNSDIPWRCKARSACFSHLSVLEVLCEGAQLADVVSIVGSLDIVLGEVDR